jgi:hypothetical protein
MDMDIITFIKVGMLKWAGHVFRIDHQRPTERILKAKPEDRRDSERPELRCQDGVDNDVKALVERNWKPYYYISASCCTDGPASVI